MENLKINERDIVQSMPKHSGVGEEEDDIQDMDEIDNVEDNDPATLLQSSPIPIDLIIEIMSRLPAKSIARFRSVSKLWGSMLRSPYFTEMFLTRSRARPRLIFVVKTNTTKWSFYSSTQVHEKASSAAFHMNMKFPKGMFSHDCEYTSGLIYFSRVWTQKHGTVPLICNPYTGHYAILPEPNIHKECFNGLFGFDPIAKQFKVLYIMTRPEYCHDEDHHKILTLGSEKSTWRAIQFSFKHDYIEKRICINGVLYYLARSDTSSYVIVCFDVRSETFKSIDDKEGLVETSKLINYKGKLGGIFCNYVYYTTLEVTLCVLEDAEKQEWSKYVYTFWDENQLLNANYVSVVGMTSTGEIVLSKRTACKPFYVYYFDPERKTLHRVEIQGVGEDLNFHDPVYAFLDYVENLNLNDAKQLKSSHDLIVDIIRERPMPQETSLICQNRDIICNSAPSPNHYLNWF